MRPQRKLFLKIGVATAAAAAFVSVAQSTYAQCIKYNGPLTVVEQNTDRPGSDHLPPMELVYRGPYPLGDPRQEQCRSDCGKTVTCYAWTYVKPTSARGSGFCYHKFTNPNPVSNTRTTSGMKWEDHIDRPGSDIDVKDTDMAASCEWYCKQNASCMSWTLVRNTRKCFLKNTIPRAYYNPNTVSSWMIRECIR